MKNVNDFERVTLGFFPTPLESLPRLSDTLGVNVKIKRDDYSGFGGGGNKVRKLEYLMAEAWPRRGKRGDHHRWPPV